MPLVVGAAQIYETPCAAIAAAVPGQEIDIQPGTYTDSCEIHTAGLWLRGLGPGRPIIDLSSTNHPADYKGIYVVSADGVTIDNLELTGAHVDDSEGGNAAGLRVTGQGIVVRGCYIHDNQNGVLAAPIVDGGTITIENTELSHNGLGDACDNGGCVHNVYISDTSASVRYDQTIFQFNWSHDLASDTADKGHLLKSRSRETDVFYNRITGETGHDSYEVDLPNGGLGLVVGNVIEKGPDADNPTLLSYGEEGLNAPSTSLYVVSNTFVNDFTSGTFIDVAPGSVLTAHDNILYGPGTPSNAGAVPADNLAGTNPLFVDPADYDYHLQATSPAIGKAVAAGMAGSMSLTPVFEYVQPLLSVARASANDLGAFEYGTVITGTGGDGGGESSSGGDDAGAGPASSSGGASSGGTSVASSGGASSGATGAATDGGESVPGGSDTARETGGCGCSSVGTQASGAGGLAGLVFASMVWLRSRRSRRRIAKAPRRQ